MEYETVTEGFNRNYQALSFVPDLNNERDISYWKHLIQYALWYMCLLNNDGRLVEDVDIEWYAIQSRIAVMP